MASSGLIFLNICEIMKKEKEEKEKERRRKTGWWKRRRKGEEEEEERIMSMEDHINRECHITLRCSDGKQSTRLFKMNN